MKSFNNLYDEIVNYSNLDLSLNNVLKGRVDYLKYPDHLEYDLKREENLGILLDKLESNIWVPGNLRKFRLFEPKQRDILAPQFEDRIIHHAINNNVEQLFTNKFIHHSYACIKNKGSQKAVKAVQSMMRSYNQKYKNPYIIQADISKYFLSIDQEILIQRFNRTIKCTKTRELYKLIISHNKSHFPQGVGIPIGSLTSQLSANIYLDIIDQRMVNYFGYGQYVRYMDDIVILCKSKTHAIEALHTLDSEVSSIKLRLNPKTEYFPVQRGADFVGYRILLTHILPRKRTISRFKDKLSVLSREYNSNIITFSDIRPILSSAIGYAKHCRSENTINNLVYEFLYSLDINSSKHQRIYNENYIK